MCFAPASGSPLGPKRAPHLFLSCSVPSSRAISRPGFGIVINYVILRQFFFASCCARFRFSVVDRMRPSLKFLKSPSIVEGPSRTQDGIETLLALYYFSWTRQNGTVRLRSAAPFSEPFSTERAHRKWEKVSFWGLLISSGLLWPLSLMVRIGMGCLCVSLSLGGHSNVKCFYEFFFPRCRGYAANPCDDLKMDGHKFFAGSTPW